MKLTSFSKSSSSTLLGLGHSVNNNDNFSSCINLKCFGHVRDKTQLRYTADYWTRDEIKVFGEMLQARLEAKSATETESPHDEL